MRFVPSLDASLQMNESAWTPEYYSDSEVESDYSPTSSNTSNEDIDKLPEFLSTQRLEKRFSQACSIVENSKKQLFRSPLNRTIVEESSDVENDDDEPSDNEDQHNANNLTNYYVARFSDEREKRNKIVVTLIKQEEDRIRQEEEERRRKTEEERRLKEEAERKAREEAERLRQEELKRQEEEKKRIELEEKAKQEALKKEEELKLQKKKEDALAAKAEAAAKKEEAVKKAQEEQDKLIIKPKDIEAAYLKYSDHIKQIELTVLQPMNEAQNKNTKKICGAHRRKINPKFGQLTNSQTQLTRITTEVNELIVQCLGDELAYKWILNFVADAIISQAETEVSVKPKASIQLAKLTLNLLILFDELSYYLLAKFYTSCPYLLGYSCSQDTEEGRIRLGWHRDEDTGKWENEVQYNERLSGISTLYSVITKLKLDSSYMGYTSTTKHPLPISNSWIFLSRMVDLPESQLTEAHYTMVGAWWDACAFEFLQAYGIQSRKLLTLLVNQWSSLGGKSSAAKVRLKLLGEEWMKGTVKSFPPLER